MNAYELADELQETEPYYSTDYKLFDKSANMLRQQADRIAELEKSHIELEKGIVADLNKRQSAKPVAWMDKNDPTIINLSLKWVDDIPLYTTPQIKELSDEEIYEIGKQYLTQYEDGLYDFARAILKKASEK